MYIERGWAEGGGGAEEPLTSGTGMTGVWINKPLCASPQGMTARTNIDLLNSFFTKGLPHLLCELDTHILPAAMDRYAIHTTIRSCEVNILEEVWSVGSSLNDLAEMYHAALLEENSLSGQDVSDMGEAELPQSNGF